MSMEPERPIENLLRAWAKKRRDDAGAPLEMHPATRRLLQGEVARRFAKEPRQPRSFSQALAGVLAAIVLPTLRGTKKTATFASNERGMLARNEEAVSAPSPAGGPAAAPTTVNAPASEVRLAYDKSAAGEQGKEALGLRDERVEKEKNGSLTLGEPPAKEKAPALSVAAADTFTDTEGARRDASGVLHETPPATLESEAFRRRSGLADNPVSSQDQLAAPAQQPTALGGALADRPLAG